MKEVPDRRAASAAASPAMRRALDALKAGRATRIWPEIADPTEDQRAAMPHAIDCQGLTADVLGESFAAELHRRKDWCRENCAGFFAVGPIRRSPLGPATGRWFWFSDQTDAAAFRLSFC